MAMQAVVIVGGFFVAAVVLRAARAAGSGCAASPTPPALPLLMLAGGDLVVRDAADRQRAVAGAGARAPTATRCDLTRNPAAFVIGDEAAVAAEPGRGAAVAAGPLAVLLAPADARADRSGRRPGPTSPARYRRMRSCPPRSEAMRMRRWLLADRDASWRRRLAPAAQSPRKINVAHRGASAYAPEHTLAAYRLALEQGADFVEQDLAVTRDGVLICLHDPTLERTTDVEQRFPDRGPPRSTTRASAAGSWLANDFTLAEIKTPRRRLVVRPEVRGRARADLRRGGGADQGKAGLYPELKTPEIYEGRDVRLRGAGRGGARPPRPARAGCRSEDAGDPADLRRVDARGRWRAMKIGVPVVLLIEPAATAGTPRRWSRPGRASVQRLRPGQGHRR